MATIAPARGLYYNPRKIEEVILKVSKKELKYITYFGGILGGIIGLMQVAVRF